VAAASPTPGLSVRDLPPNIFAVVMATGIVSLAANGAAMPILAHALFWVNLAAFAVLWVLLLARCARHRDALLADLASHAKAPGFFTVVAGTCVLGNQCVLLGGAWEAGLALGCLGAALWFGLTYTVLPGLMESDSKPPLEKGLNGAWLLLVVATQAVSVLACLVAPHLPGDAAGPALFVALGFWLVGGMLYIWLIALIFYRFMFLPLGPGDLTPPYWINMGAMAISTLAGVFLVRDAGRFAALAELLPFLKGMTLLFWATATWWIPMLVALGVWRHVRQRFPLTYDHGYWAAVFPLGMYTVCTQNLTRELRLPFLSWIPDVFVWLALGAWVMTAAGLAAHLVRLPPAR
jgi:tellurite resistance protein TehA-like permease